MKSKNVKIVVFVPVENASAVREAMHGAGAGKIGNYEKVSFSAKGVGRFLPMEGANPFIGAVGKVEEVEEERVEMICEREKLGAVVEAMKEAHPYEEVAFDVYQLEGL